MFFDAGTEQNSTAIYLLCRALFDFSKSRSKSKPQLRFMHSFALSAPGSRDSKPTRGATRVIPSRFDKSINELDLKE